MALSRSQALLLAASLAIAQASSTILAQTAACAEGERPGVPPLAKDTCPSTHPIKGNFTTLSGERCIYHLPGQSFYKKTLPERCYATEVEAVRDGCRKSKA